MILVCSAKPGSSAKPIKNRYIDDRYIYINQVEKPCSPNAQCADNTVWFSCTCNRGFYGDGFKCQALHPPQCGIRRYLDRDTSIDRGANGLSRYSDFPAFPIVKRIVGGDIAEIKDWPWMANIREVVRNGYVSDPFCGASILNDKFLISAAHCLPRKLDSYSGKLKIFVGDWHIARDKVEGMFWI